MQQRLEEGPEALQFKCEGPNFSLHFSASSPSKLFWVPMQPPRALLTYSEAQA